MVLKAELDYYIRRPLAWTRRPAGNNMVSDKPKLLIVDDEKDISYILKKGLTPFGFDVTTYDDPVEASQHYQPNIYAGIILDIRMPKMSGFELARAIWKLEPEAKICFLSAFDIYEHEARALFPNLKSSCFLTKPVGIECLVTQLKRHGIAAHSAPNSD